MIINAFLMFLWLLPPQAPSSQPAGLTLQEVVDFYVQHGLELEAARYRVERTKAEQIAARMRPNPGLTITAENFKFSGRKPFDQLYEVATSYSQPIELGGKRGLRMSVADLTVSAAEAQFADAMRRGIADVKRLYYEALLARYNVEVARENRQTFEQLVQFNLARFQEGAIPEADLIKVRLERIKFDSAVQQSQLSLRQGVIRLMEKIDVPESGNRTVAGEFDFRGANLALAALKEETLSTRSDIRAAELQLQVSAERLKLEHARSVPDLVPFAGYKRAATDNTVLFGVNIALRIRDRNQAGIARAEADQKIAQTELQLLRSRAIAEVEAAWAAYETAIEQVRAFRSEMLQQADESRSIALTAYEEGATELLSVLEAQRTRAEVRQQYFKTLFDYHTSVLQLEVAVGREIQP